MLATQVDYWKLIESKRHNMREEELAKMSHEESVRHNVALEQENVRHNQQQEFLTSVQLNEAQRHNVQGERLSSATIAENKRHNTVEEGISQYSAQSGAVKDVATKSSAVLNEVHARTDAIGTIGNVLSGAFKTMSIIF